MFKRISDFLSTTLIKLWSKIIALSKFKNYGKFEKRLK
jgi:hypothetical protein